MNHGTTLPVARRTFLRDGSLVLCAASVVGVPAALRGGEARRRVRLGMVTDLHYADKPAAGTRHYRETLEKFAEARERFIAAKTDGVVSLGDLIDAAESVEAEQRDLKRIYREFAEIPGDRRFVLGNHCVSTLTKEEFLAGVEQPKSYGSFDLGGQHFVVLDACFRADGVAYGRNNFEWTDANVSAEQLEWLRDDLGRATAPTVVFVHQRLDVEGAYGIKNAPAVRKILEASRRVVAVFQGHSHKNDHNEIGGIHYCTLVAMVEGTGPESSGYSLLDWYDDGSLRISGFRKQAEYRWG